MISMEKLSLLAERIRELTYKWNSHMYELYFKARPDEWSALCVAMDTLDDTCLALEDFESQGLSDRENEKYLRLYGTLQAVFLQQESIRHLHKVFTESDVPMREGSAWKEIRDLRNLTVSHPIEFSGKKHCFISRVTIEDEGYQIIVWNKDKQRDEIIDVDLHSVYEGYKSEAVACLEAIHNAEVARWPKQVDSQV